MLLSPKQRKTISWKLAQVAGKMAPTSLILFLETNDVEVEHELAIGLKTVGCTKKLGKDLLQAWRRFLKLPTWDTVRRTAGAVHQELLDLGIR